MKTPLLAAGMALIVFLRLPRVDGATATIKWSGMMLHFSVGNGIEEKSSHTYASALALDTLSPESLHAGLLKVDHNYGPPGWKAVGFYRIETPGNPYSPQARFDDFIVNVPMDDLEGDGVPDIVEPEDGLASVTTTGIFEDNGYSDAIEMEWNRAAGSTKGRCVIHFSGSPSPLDPSAYFIAKYTNEFELTGLAGSYVYASGLSHSTGTVSVARIDTAFYYESGSGPLTFLRSGPDQLQLQEGRLLYYGNNSLSYRASTQFLRSQSNYWGIVTITNGVVGSLDPRYKTWLWRIVDTNDRDQNGIPDLSDTAPAFSPELDLKQEGQNIVLTVTGEPDADYTLQKKPALNQTLWSEDGTLKVPPSGKATIAKSLEEQNHFWRASFP